ncbi:MAG: hypothetical protein IPM17_06325 [Verrucomicrobia bacterium]|nr:hypothetical protein [Verrucomicrobiota bacterium]
MATLVAASTGCGTRPTASISHPTEFTALHLAAAQRRMDSNAVSVALYTNLSRYFASRETEYTNARLRMDIMLDEVQTTTARRNIQTLDFALALIAAAKANGDSEGSATNHPPTVSNPPKESEKEDGQGDKSQGDSYQTKAAEALAKMAEIPIVDSPFDRLDRVSDFYAAYLLKHLRLLGDSRAVNTPALEHWFTNSLPATMLTNLTSLKDKPPTHRLLFLVMQTQVTAGSKANHMTGVRVRLKDNNGDPVPVLRLHPSRTYDLDLTAVQDESTLSWKIEGAGKPDPSLTVEGRLGGRSKQETLKRFYARLGKVSGYVDAGRGEFGWDFYPSNLRMVQANVTKSFWGLFFGTVERLRTKGFLEAGGRDAFALVLVPWDAPHLTYQVQSSTSSFSPDGAGLLWRSRTPRPEEGWSKPQTIPLSRASPWEAVAATVPLLSGVSYASDSVTPTKHGEETARSKPARTFPGSATTPAGVDGLTDR